MDLAAYQALHQQVLWLAFALALGFGAIGQRSHFCTMGAVSDIVTMGDWTRMRMWALAGGVAILGFQAMALAGWIDPARTLYTSPRFIWLSAGVGGLLFGMGMVLASGCGSKTLIRLGAGNLKSLVVFFVMGVAAYATMRGITAVARVATVDRVAVEMPGNASLPVWLDQLTGLGLPGLTLGAGLAVGGALVLWALAGRALRTFDGLLGGLGMGALVLGMWWLTGHLGFVPEHPQTLEPSFVATNSGRAEAFSFVAPMAYALDWLMLFSDKSKQLTIGVVSVAGVVLGSAVQALASGAFAWEGFRDTRDTAHHLIGGALMGVGGVTAMGCTIGQGLSGLSTLSLSSFVALAGILLGAWLGLRYQVWSLERQG
jgi:uncharacterized membrane protein YedE/YeeE